MKRFKLTIAYDGTAYCGWQRQVDPTPTVQREIEKAAGFIVSHPVTVLGSSRKTPHPLPHPAPLAEIELGLLKNPHRAGRIGLAEVKNAGVFAPEEVIQRPQFPISGQYCSPFLRCGHTA